MSTSTIPTDSISTPDASQLDSQAQRPIGWKFWLTWTLATTAGWIFGALIYSVLMHMFDQAFVVLMLASFGILAGALFGGVIAAAFGILQGLVIQRIGISSRQWTSASLTGGIIGGAISAGATIPFALLIYPIGGEFHWLYLPSSTLVTDVLFLVMCGLITGATIGHRQRRILPDFFRVKLHWTKINALGWAIGCAAIVPASWLLCGGTLYPFFGIVDNYVIQSILSIAVCGLVGGAIIGYPLMHAFQQSSILNPKSEIQNEPSSPDLG